MTQTVTPTRQVGPRPTEPPPAQLGRSPLPDVLHELVEGTPGRLRMLGALAALAAVVLGLVGANTLWSSSAALERAEHNTSQVVRVQSIYTDLVRADADATSSFLVGGLENPDQRRDYEGAMARVATAVADAAKAQPADGTALGTLNTQIQSYAGLIEQARAYNRQGLPVGAQYLKNAGTTLRTQTLPIIDALTKANTERTRLELAASTQAAGLATTGAVTLLVLILVMVWLARRTHRYLNAPLAGATFAVLVALLLGSVVLGSVGATVRTVRDNDFAGTLALTTARAAAYDAKSNESLALIARGQGVTFEAAWRVQADKVTSNLKTLQDITSPRGVDVTARDLDVKWRGYFAAHSRIRELDDAGSWEAAVQAAISSEPGSASASFRDVDAASAQLLGTLQKSTAERVLGPRGQATVAGWVLLLLSLGAALLTVRGISKRLEEYR